MTGPEVTAAMKAEDVDAALVERASNALSMLRHGIPGEYSDHTRTEVRHALAAVLPEAYAEAIEHVAKRISPNSGIGLADGATRGDVAVWLLEYAAALRSKSGEVAS